MKRNFNKLRFFYSLLVLFITSVAFADTDIGFGDEVIDNTAPAAPIDNYVGVGVALGSLYIFYLVNRKIKKQT